MREEKGCSKEEPEKLGVLGEGRRRSWAPRGARHPGALGAERGNGSSEGLGRDGVLRSTPKGWPGGESQAGGGPGGAGLSAGGPCGRGGGAALARISGYK